MRAIVFDLDGTLLQFSQEYETILTETFRAVEGETGEEWIPAYTETFFELLGECEPDPVRRAFATVGENSKAFAEELLAREIEAARPPENVHEHLDTLAEEYRLGVLTNGVRSWQLQKLQAHDLDGYFETVVTSYDAGVPKPASEPFALVEKRLPAEEYAMVGDSAADVDGAKAAGWIAHRYQGQGFGNLPEALEWG